MMRLEPELVWQNGAFHRDVAVIVDPDSGRITAVEGGGPGDAGTPDGRAAGRTPGAGDDVVVRLPGRALLPGFVNGHSHAFQRLGRGRTQTRPAGQAASDFWSWREAMYGVALSLSAADVYHVARFCFLEMLRTGITAVGEFHYLHHQPDGSPYDDPNELALRVVAAARDVGLRIALLNVCYATGGIGRELEPRQRRFRADSADAFLRRTGALARALDDAGSSGRAGSDPGAGLATLGIAPHSVRAVPRDWLRPLHDWAAERDLPVHMHVSERPAEVEACQAAFGLRPVELLAEEGLLDGRFTAVHATHLSPAEIELLGGSGATVCACPTTERDLADGFLPGLELLDAGTPISLGTDSHTSLDFLEEMRLVEYHERLRRLERVVVTHGPVYRAGRPVAGLPREGGGDDDVGLRLRVAPTLLEMATSAGARSLGLEAGAIQAGRLADLVAVDLDHHALAGWTPETLDAFLTLSATPDVVRDVWVAGVRRLEDRRHAGEEEIAGAFRAVASSSGRGTDGDPTIG